ncbi:MAG: TlpA family protein disulfide reductase [Acidimicrobiales bacterium]
MTDLEPPAEPEDSPSALSNSGSSNSGSTNSSTIRTIAIVVGVVIVGLVGLLAFGGSDLGAQPNATLGKRVPLVQGMPIEGLAGTSVNQAGEPVAYSIDAKTGQWTLVNFFATWCTGCIVEHPELVKLEAWGTDNDLGIVAVVFDDPNTGAIQRFFTEQGGNWPVLDSPRSAVDFQISQIPESFLVAPNGLVVEHYVGGLSAAEVQATIAELTT